MTQMTKTPLSYPDPPAGVYRDELDIVAKTNFVYRYGPAAFDALPWRRPAPAAPARDPHGKFAAEKKRRSQMTTDDKTAYIAKHGIEAFYE